MQVTTATPVEIDAKLAELYYAENTLQDRVASRISSIRTALGHKGTKRGRGAGSYVEWPCTNDEAIAQIREMGEAYMGMGRYAHEVVGRYDAAVAELAANRAEQAPLHAEFNRRGGWTRFFAVQAGHYHRSMHCSTCHKGKERTQFGWVVEMSGRDEAEAIAELAEAAHTLCTVCFPNAPVVPTTPAPVKTAAEKTAEREAAEREARITDAKLIADVDGEPLRVDGDTVRTVRTAEIKAVDGLVWAAYNRHTGTPNEPNAVKYEGHTRQIVAALAAKNGTTPADELARITAKAIKKVRCDLGAEVATAAAAVWAAPAAPPVTEAGTATPPAVPLAPVRIAPALTGELAHDVTGRPIRVGALVECIGHPHGVLTGRHGRVAESTPGRVVLTWPNRTTATTTARSSGRVRLVAPATMRPATIGRSATVHAYHEPTGEAGCGYFNRAEARVVRMLPADTPATCTAAGCGPR